MAGGRAQAIQPAPPVFRTGRGERGARHLLGIKAIGHALRRIAPLRQRARHRLAGKVIAKAGQHDFSHDASVILSYARTGIVLRTTGIDRVTRLNCVDRNVRGLRQVFV